MGDKRCDVVVIGAGPAGATAALLLAKEGFSVLLVERAVFPRAVPCTGWLTAKSLPLLEELGVRKTAMKKRALSDITFHKADFSETAKPQFEEAPGYLIDRSQFDHMLLTAAEKQGVEVIQGVTVQDANLLESHVVLKLDNGTTREAKLLVVAAGRDTPLLQRVGIDMASADSLRWLALVESASAKASGRQAPKMDIVLGLDHGSSFGLCSRSAECVSVSVSWVGDREEARRALIQLCRQAHEHKIVPVDLTAAAAAAPTFRLLAAAALDMDTHVGKHTLVIGEAGGFVSAASNEGIYPSMWSAQIAVEVLVKALRSVQSQDELMGFDSAWRIQMADYLRSPHTDVQFLIPLIFSNQPMADRMGAAFFLGENI